MSASSLRRSTLAGGADDDLIYLGDGDDSVAGYAYVALGNDTVYGEEGDDVINALDGTSSPDTVDGGAGHDHLLLDDGDIGTGGDGEDLFSIYHSDYAEEPAILITDFNTDDDLLSIDTYSTDPVELIHDPERAAVLVQRTGVTLGILEGLSEADIPNINFVEIAA